MIKIKPFNATDKAQVRALLRHQDSQVPFESFYQEERILGSGLMFWQHWLPCNWHMAPSVYVAKDDGVALGLISLDSSSKSGSCWRINHLVVHPGHRGRGIGAELLKYVLALFGGQGINHFTCEVSDQNSAALALMSSTGFRRCARINYYQVSIDSRGEIQPERAEQAAQGDQEGGKFRLATPEDRELLLALVESVLPADLRRMFNYVPNDYYVPELNVDSFEKLGRRLIRRKTWYWLMKEEGRDALPCACKVTAHSQGDFHVEFFVNPGWEHTAPELIEFTLSIMRRAGMKGMVVIKVHDYQKPVLAAIEKASLERIGSFSLMAREHWLRAKQKSLQIDPAVGLNLGTPAVNIPFAGAADGARVVVDLDYNRLVDDDRIEDDG